MIKVKICGITNLEDLKLADNLGADFLGFILYPPSPRFIGERLKEVLSIPTRAQKVAVFVNPTYEEVKRALDLGADLVQLHGEEEPNFAQKIGFAKVIKAFRIKENFSLELCKPFSQAFALLLDTYVEGTYGGTGKSFNWQVAKEVVKAGYKIFLAGGLNPENIAQAIEEVKPFGIDLSSGLEAKKGKKDPEKMAKLFQVLRGVTTPLNP